MIREIEGMPEQPIITAQLDKTDLLVLAYGVIPPYGGNEYTEFDGNQWNESWEWDIEKLSQLSKAQLWDMYCKAKEEGRLRW
jgi:hypothetical protein